MSPATRSPLRFLTLLIALSIPFWLLGFAFNLELLPGVPISALTGFAPTIAASILVYKATGINGVHALMRRAIDYHRIRSTVWYAPIVLLMPAVTVLAYGLMRVRGYSLPAWEFSAAAAIALFLAFLIEAAGEELGLSGYLLDVLQTRLRALDAAILLGSVWAGWHIVPLLQAHRAAGWIAVWCLYTIAQRVVMTWLYNNTGHSVFGAILYHATGNVCWQLFPNHGSHWDPRVVGSILAVLAATVTVVWGPRTLARGGSEPLEGVASRPAASRDPQV